MVDVGNTRIKLGIFEKEQLNQLFVPNDWSELKALVEEYHPTHILVSSVRGDQAQIKEYLVGHFSVIMLDRQTPLPLQNHYHSPETLGLDRIAAAAGAWHLFPGEAALIIDMGTSITYDFVDGQGAFKGGSIAPGMQMRFQSLHEYTARLPLVQANPEEEPLLTGRSTVEAIKSGVLYGIIAEIRGMILSYRENYDVFKVIMTGGDMIYFESKIKEQIFAVRELTLVGLNSILTYNVGQGN